MAKAKGFDTEKGGAVVENARFYAPKRTIAFSERFRGANRWYLSVLEALERRTIAAGRVLDHYTRELIEL